jgi:hypothetical protein
MVRIILAIAIFSSAAALAWLAAPSSSVQAHDLPTESPPSQLYRGAVTCASAACHNGNDAPGTKGSEYTTWVTADKHHEAYAVLFTDQSRTIERNYRRLGSLEKAHPETDLTCLKCHVGNGADTGSTAVYVDGVGCESCHGPSGKWFSTHYLPEWAHKTSQEKEALGMRSTKDLAVRAEQCAACHVGSPDKQVDHDLIAAGHPRLNFEFAAYLANMPKHWDERKDRDAVVGFEAKAWALGQAVSARAALELLANRAADKTRPWPEFAEYECFACHHSLASPGSGQEHAGKAGSLQWGTWYFALANRLPGAKQDGSAFQELRSRMQGSAPDRQKVHDEAVAASGNLQRMVDWLKATPFDTVQLHKLQETLTGEPKQSWDAAAQSYLARVAIHQARTDLGPEQREAERLLLEGARRKLEFKTSYNSPSSLDSRLQGGVRD